MREKDYIELYVTGIPPEMTEVWKSQNLFFNSRMNKQSSRKKFEMKWIFEDLPFPTLSFEVSVFKMRFSFFPEWTEAAFLQPWRCNKNVKAATQTRLYNNSWVSFDNIYYF